MITFKQFISEAEDDDKKVIYGKFGKGSERKDLDIPQGYKSFFTRPFGKSSYEIVGVKPDGTEKHVKTVSSKEGAETLAKEYNSGGKAGTGIEKISLLKAFGSDEINILHDAGIHFVEKPDYWEDLDKKPISEPTLKKAEKELAKHGVALKTYTSVQIWGRDPKGPTSKFVNQPEETCFIVKLKNGQRYLVDRTGANTYIRMWVKIT